MKTRKLSKYVTMFVVQQYTGDQYRWEDVCQSLDFREANSDLKSYRQNQPEYAARLIRRRVLRESEV